MLVSENSELSEQSADRAAAFARVFCAEHPRLWQLIRFRLDQRLQRRVDVDDVLQDVYLQAAKRYEAYLASDYPTPYLWLRDVAIQTLANTHRFHLRTQLRNLRREAPAEHLDAASSPDPVYRLAAAVTTPSQAAVRSETVEAVRKALTALRPADREMIELRQFEELSNDETAYLLGIGRKAASIRYVRALGRLRLLIEKSAPEFVLG